MKLMELRTESVVRTSNITKAVMEIEVGQLSYLNLPDAMKFVIDLFTIKASG